ncbi:hypothetical protein OS493_004143 [Desmophyllum pertusum]|uniref:Nuclear cap-binding protein subunit 3 n=1 Tax=Desmophyllum pertusum TaxID=174260 RepID=A0A9X0D4M9_9CNID|nr:hypothetical protein OS493_004143 [Desmophyllum pertusum]
MEIEFEDLKVEIPVDDDDSDNEEKDLPFTFERRYENKSGCFVTGFDVTSKEALERKARRAKRFGLQQKHKDTEKTDSQSDQETDDTILPSIDPKQLPTIPEGEARLDAILIHGVDGMSTKDVFAYFGDFAPGSVEWIDDSSCNVVWDDDFTASRVLLAIGKEIQKPTVDDDDISDTVSWKIGPPHTKAEQLLLRLATRSSKKGIISSSRKRKLLNEQERVKHMYSGGPDVLFLDKIETEKDEKMDVDEPPLKIIVTNDGPTERSDPANPRMRMYADSVEEEESESDEDNDDRREMRDKWKGRIGRKPNTREEVKKKLLWTYGLNYRVESDTGSISRTDLRYP